MKAYILASTLATAVAVNAVGNYGQCGELAYRIEARSYILTRFARQAESTTLAPPLVTADGCAPIPTTGIVNGKFAGGIGVLW